jgi:hypothetical protein
MQIAILLFYGNISQHLQFFAKSEDIALSANDIAFGSRAMSISSL